MAMPEVAHKWYRMSKKMIITSMAQRQKIIEESDLCENRDINKRVRICE
jgi:hypothetical protein